MILNIYKDTKNTYEKQLNETSFAALFRTYTKEPDKKAVKSINVIPNNANICKIYSDGLSVYANATFYPNDIIEICPTREVTKSALYDNDVRSIIFEVVKNEQFVIPFGYCQYYDLVENEITIPNCDYIWDPNTKVIVIKATTRIEPGTKLILNISK